MVVSEDSQGVTVDCSVGSIVWVRRRNGSWWPGKILGPNELSASHLMSPRSGTPVKLLGREDASVAPFYECLCICRVEFILSPLRDWYNLEKSKRVKAFRCGEFDDCIGRAESSQGIPIKKREKYARREDAILHALELERQQLEQKQVKLGMAANCIGDTMIGVSRKQFPSENSLGKDDTRDQNYKFINLKSQTLSKRLDSSFEEDSNPSHNQKIKKANKLGWEDDNAEAIPRMRGLQDFGLKIAPSKGRLSASIVCESSCKSVLVENQVSSGKNSLAAKRKRSHGGPTEESLVKRRDRRRPLLQVLQSSPKLLACQALQSDRDAVSNSMREEEHMGVLCEAKGAKILSYALPNDLEMDISQSQFGLENRALHPVSLTEENACSSLIKEEESDSLEGDFLNLDSEEEGAMLSGCRNSESFTGCNSFGFRAQGKLVNIGNEGLDECGFSNYMPHFQHLERSGGVSADASVSKWQLKGKRNIRYLTKKPTELMDGNKCNGSRHKASWEVKRTAIKTMRTGISSQWPSGQGFPHKNVNELNYAYDQGDMSEKDFAETDRVGFGSRRYQLMPNSYFRDRGRNSDRVMDSVDNSCAISLSEMNRFSNLPSSLNSEGCWLSQASLSGYWEESDRGFDPLKLYGYREADPSWEGNLMESMLVDVDLKVQATYQGERVPLVSLMSRLNGKAIVGHPVHIEVLDDGATDLLLSSNDCHEGPTDKSGSSGLPPIWCTARRTAMPRVPRVQPSSPPEDEVWEPNQRAVIENSRPPSKKPYANYFNHRLRLVKNSFSHIRRPMMEKLSRKILKKVSLSKKTRMLSSIAIDQKPSGKSGNSMLGSKNSCDSDVLVKNEITPIMCVSVKLVFSRILEALGEPQPKPS